MPSTRSSRQIRSLQVADKDLAAGDISRVSKVFDQVVASPMYSKSLRGGIVFAFGSHDKDPRHNFEIEEIRRYTRLIDARYPYFPYFLPEDPQLQQIINWFASLATPVEPDPDATEGITVDPRAFLEIVVARIEAVREFCAGIADNPASTEKAILAAVPEEIAAAVRERLPRLS